MWHCEVGDPAVPVSDGPQEDWDYFLGARRWISHS